MGIKRVKKKKKSKKKFKHQLGSNLQNKIAKAIGGETIRGQEHKVKTNLELAHLARTGESRPSSSPGIKARAQNRARTGQDVPVVVEGKLDKRPLRFRPSDSLAQKTAKKSIAAGRAKRAGKRAANRGRRKKKS